MEGSVQLYKISIRVCTVKSKKLFDGKMLFCVINSALLFENIYTC